jgi:hypothetical protein
MFRMDTIFAFGGYTAQNLVQSFDTRTKKWNHTIIQVGEIILYQIVCDLTSLTEFECEYL